MTYYQEELLKWGCVTFFSFFVAFTLYFYRRNYWKWYREGVAAVILTIWTLEALQQLYFAIWPVY